MKEKEGGMRGERRVWGAWGCQSEGVCDRRLAACPKAGGFRLPRTFGASQAGRGPEGVMSLPAHGS